MAARATRSEEVLKPAESGEPAEIAHEDVDGFVEVEAGGSRSGARTANALLPVPVVECALFRVAQNLVRLGDLLEPLLGLLGALVAVGVVLQRELSVRLLDLLAVGVP